MASYIRRRKFLATLIGGVAAWPVAARAQQGAIPVIGFLSSRSPGESAGLVLAFRQGLQEAWICRGPKRIHCVSVGGGSLRPIAGARS
jgi:putative ABC transport system substrate-binding protein